MGVPPDHGSVYLHYLVNMIERPEGLQIAVSFILAIIVTSSCLARLTSTELRVERN